MDSRHIDASATRCMRCTAPLCDRQRVTLDYLAGDLFYAREQLDFGVILDVRIYYTHVDCADTELLRGKYRVIPTIEQCIKCKQKLRPVDFIQPVYQITGVDAVNPNDPTDKGIELGERLHFVHVDCTAPTLSNSLLVSPS
jgi:hypothetical protein